MLIGSVVLLMMYVLCRVCIYYGSPRVLLSLEDAVGSMPANLLFLLTLSNMYKF